MARPRALIVDDEPDLCELVGITLRRMDIDSRAVHDLAGARRALEDGRYNLCLTDMRLPDGDGLELLEWMQEQVPNVPVAMITAHGNVEAAVRALKLGAFDFVSKPVDLASLRKLVNTALKVRSDEPPPEGAAEPTDDGRLLGESPAMQRVKEMVRKVARSQAPVHIRGESGTGKELVARMIHESGPRAELPFVPVNCGAIPAELMESEFFGHRKGSFTGATADKAGLFRSAEGGTLFLDEVAELPLHMQVKLLRAIQEKAIRPVGEARETPVDVRILSATHKNLAEMIRQGDFREDLYYRINVIELLVPPLRQRGPDKMELARYFLKRLGEQAGAGPLRLDDDATAQIERYDFPGNVRELENVLERAATLCSDGRITPADLLLREAPQDTDPARADGRLEERLGEVERDAIVAALEKTRYNKTAAAKLLGLSFRQLRYRIKKLNIE